ncbi:MULTISPECIES: energy transducer TonB [Vibrio]|uniref:energy transducer TonB n=1 Tax=Vibrio TaxID=662 RepID=UPI0005851735|nr:MULTISPECIES: energy transducer TonB [Vibrio]KIF50335.1 energy transducer TonB [Vibrio owensii 47666-1]MBS9984315.1 energy transducer TonB [Vibrio alginolyticus]MDF5283514.1 energy transducer TonB [Vibrio parahaemolyticus]HCE5206450.1 energy transducer TonB [Vibrio parahaemolyticus]
MRNLILLSISLLVLGGCASKQEVYLTQSPIQVEQNDLEDYWIQSSEEFSFSLKSNMKLPKTGGYVQINYLIDSNGEIFNPTIVDSSPKGEWDLIALKALSKVEYVPSEFNSSNIPVYVTSEFKFVEQ